MYRIINEICELCALENDDKLNQQLKKEKPKWFATNGSVLAKYYNSYCNKRLAKSVGPTLVWESYCSDCGAKLTICAKHIREILIEIEKYSI